MMREILFFTAAVFLLSLQALSAQVSPEKHLPLDGRINADGRAVKLSWLEANPPRVGSVTIKRRLLGQIGPDSWQAIAPALGPVMGFTDEATKPGVAYEYQVQRTARDIVDVGYWTTGVELPAREFRGAVYVVVDETVLDAIIPRLRRFERDLIGDGWRILRREVPRGNSRRPAENFKYALGIKNWLRDRYLEDPFGQHAVVLVGHIPVVKSGRANPDGHEPTPHASDLFYADTNGKWTLNSEGLLVNNRLPSDFIEMQIGRIDFSNVSSNGKDQEVRLLQSYFDKNHHWRMGLFGDLRSAYGNSGHLQAEMDGLRNIVGPGSVVPGGHHDVGEEKPWLWGVDLGDWNGRRYAEDYANKAVFAINFGSGKQKIDSPFNAMTTLLAQPWYPIATGWGGRPAWWLHHMALGGTIGDVHMRTVNNGSASKPYPEAMEYFPTGRYLFRNPVWVNLLGDPTTRPFMLAPATGVTTEGGGQTVALSWTASADSDVTGYRIYRAALEGTTFKALNDGQLVEGLEFIDEVPETGARYMVRAYGLKRVYAGSFYTFSQGAFAEVGVATGLVTELRVKSPSDQTVTLPKAFSHVVEEKIHAFIEGPAVGQLRHNGTDWLYTPPANFAGTLTVRFSVSDALQTAEGLLKITVGGE